MSLNTDKWCHGEGFHQKRFFEKWNKHQRINNRNNRLSPSVLRLSLKVYAMYLLRLAYWKSRRNSGSWTRLFKQTQSPPCASATVFSIWIATSLNPAPPSEGNFSLDIPPLIHPSCWGQICFSCPERERVPDAKQDFLSRWHLPH